MFHDRTRRYRVQNIDICTVLRISMPAMLELPHAGCYMPAVAVLGGRTSHGSAPSTFAGSQEVQAGIHSAQGAQMQSVPMHTHPVKRGSQLSISPIWFPPGPLLWGTTSNIQALIHLSRVKVVPNLGSCNSVQTIAS